MLNLTQRERGDIMEYDALMGAVLETIDKRIKENLRADELAREVNYFLYSCITFKVIQPKCEHSSHLAHLNPFRIAVRCVNQI